MAENFASHEKLFCRKSKKPGSVSFPDRYSAKGLARCKAFFLSGREIFFYIELVFLWNSHLSIERISCTLFPKGYFAPVYGPEGVRAGDLYGFRGGVPCFF